MKFGWMATLVVFSMAGCATPKPAPERVLYDLGPAAEIQSAPFSVRVEVQLPAWMDSADIAYRFEHDDPARLRYYATSRWAGRPSQLMVNRISARLSVNANSSAKCVLKLEVDLFEQRFSNPSTSQFHVSGRWSALAWNAPGVVLAGAAFNVQEAAGGDAPAGVGAAARAIDRLQREISTGLAGLPACK